MGIAKPISRMMILPDNEDNIRRLIEQLNTPIGIIPFIGAGISIPYGFPGWSDFLIQEAKKAGIETEIKKHLEVGKYEEAAEEILRARGPLAFKDAIENTFGDHKIKGSVLQGAVSWIPQIASGPVITTNFDHVLEMAFQEARVGFEQVVWGAKVDSAIKAMQQSKRFLLKIHGDADDSADRILTQNDYEKHYGSQDGSTINLQLPIPQLLTQMLITRPLLFIGCSLNNDRIITLLKNVSRNFRSTAHYAILQFPDSEGQLYERSRFLSDHNIRPIWFQKDFQMIEVLLSYLNENIEPQFSPFHHRGGKLKAIQPPGKNTGPKLETETKEFLNIVAVDEAIQNDRKQLTDIASVSPKAALLEAWLKLESTAFQVLKRKDPQVKLSILKTPIQIGIKLESLGLINESHKEIFAKLRNLRNAAAHATDFKIGAESAIEYIEMALGLISHLRAQK